jgi:hypothetical protein
MQELDKVGTIIPSLWSVHLRVLSFCNKIGSFGKHPPFHLIESNRIGRNLKLCQEKKKIMNCTQYINRYIFQIKFYILQLQRYEVPITSSDNKY